MVQQTAGHPSTPLRAITQRLTSTSPEQLPYIIPYLATAITSCGNHLSEPKSHGREKDDSETVVLLHKYKTQISTLLQEKSVESRWAAVVLIKATVEVGGWEILHGAGPWARGLLGILGVCRYSVAQCSLLHKRARNGKWKWEKDVLIKHTLQKPDPVTTKRLCIITLTRIFVLTREYQTLLREITTPSLPGFITSCLNSVTSRTTSRDVQKSNVHSPLLETVLEALGELLPCHPTSFRPFVGQIRSLILRLLAPTPSNLLQDGSTKHSIIEISPSSGRCTAAARRLFVLLHCCAANNTSGDEWNKALRTIIANIHNTTDQVFRAVFEDWEPSSKTQTNRTNARDYGAVISDAGTDVLGLPGWKGIHAGCERLSGLLLLLQSSLATPNSSAVSLPVGAIIDIITRILSVLVPAGTKHAAYEGSVRLNPEIGREEREALWARLPHIHIAALRTLSTVLARLGAASAALSHGLLDLLLWVFRSEHTSDEIRTSTYGLVAQILGRFGPSLPRSAVSSMSSLIRACCKDLLPSQERPAGNLTVPGNKAGQGNGMSSTRADFYLHAATLLKPQTCSLEIQAAAAALLPLLLTSLPQNILSSSLRSQIDRTAILSRNKEAMLASVLNPSEGKKGTSSIMPLLARGFPEVTAVEAVIRPRMPVLQRRRDDDGDTESDEGDNLDLRYSNTYVKNETGTMEGTGLSPEISTQLEIGIDVVERAIGSASEDPALPPSTVEMQGAEPPILEVSNKRRWSDSGGKGTSITVPNPVAVLPDSPQGGRPVIKRVRLDSEATDLVADSTAALPVTTAGEVAAVGLSADVLSAVSTAMPAATASSATPTKAINAEADSDDDDFEIPPLDMGLDTDEEDDEDEEDDD